MTSGGGGGRHTVNLPWKGYSGILHKNGFDLEVACKSNGRQLQIKLHFMDFLSSGCPPEKVNIALSKGIFFHIINTPSKEQAFGAVLSRSSARETNYLYLPLSEKVLKARKLKFTFSHDFPTEFFLSDSTLSFSVCRAFSSLKENGSLILFSIWRKVTKIRFLLSVSLKKIHHDFERAFNGGALKQRVLGQGGSL